MEVNKTIYTENFQRDEGLKDINNSNRNNLYLMLSILFIAFSIFLIFYIFNIVGKVTISPENTGAFMSESSGVKNSKPFYNYIGKTIFLILPYTIGFICIRKKMYLRLFNYPLAFLTLVIYFFFSRYFSTGAAYGWMIFYYVPVVVIGLICTFIKGLKKDISDNTKENISINEPGDKPTENKPSSNEYVGNNTKENILSGENVRSNIKENNSSNEYIENKNKENTLSIESAELAIKNKQEKNIKKIKVTIILSILWQLLAFNPVKTTSVKFEKYYLLIILSLIIDIFLLIMTFICINKKKRLACICGILASTIMLITRLVKIFVYFYYFLHNKRNSLFK